MKKNIKKITKNTVVLNFKCSRLAFLGDKIEDERSFFIDQGIDVNNKGIDFFGASKTIYFGKSTSYEDGLGKAAEKSMEFLKKGHLVAEATFTNKDAVVRCDVANLVNGKLNFIEIKSSKSKDKKDKDGIKEEYLIDIAAQYALLKHIGVKVGKMSLALLNHEAIGPEAKDLFKTFDVSERIKPYVKAIDLKKIIKENNEEIPQQNFCQSCKGCDHFKGCWPMYPEKHATVHLPRIKFEKLDILHQSKIYNGIDVNPSELTENQKLARECWQQDKPVIIKEEFKKYDKAMREKGKNIYLLDFEVARPAIPLYDYHRPYTQLPFQYSLHTAAFKRDKALKLLEHKEFLHVKESEPTEYFIKSLIKDLNKEDYPIVVYSPYEESVLKDVARQYPKYEKKIEKIIDRFVDIHKAISKSFAHPEMNGRTSIKVVLPALSPEFSYGDLAINNGVSAFEAWVKIRKDYDATLEKDMLAYCERDTEAMFHVLNGIYAIYHGKELKKANVVEDRDVIF